MPDSFFEKMAHNNKAQCFLCGFILDRKKKKKRNLNLPYAAGLERKT